MKSFSSLSSSSIWCCLFVFACTFDFVNTLPNDISKKTTVVDQPAYRNPAGNSFISHGHWDKNNKKIRNCPGNTCVLDPETEMFFWRYSDVRFPAVFLTSDAKSIPVASSEKSRNEMSSFPISKELLRELSTSSEHGREVDVVTVLFEEPLEIGHYTLLLNDKHNSYIVLPMICTEPSWQQKIKQNLKNTFTFTFPLTSKRRSTSKNKLNCTIDKRQIRQVQT